MISTKILYAGPYIHVVKGRMIERCLLSSCLLDLYEKISVFTVINRINRVCCMGTWERSGSVVECLTRDRGAAGSSLFSVTALCHQARHINPSLVLVQPRKTCPFITERLLMGRKESNQTHTKNCMGTDHFKNHAIFVTQDILNMEITI